MKTQFFCVKTAMTAVVASLIMACGVRADAVSWTGATSSDWNDPTNWAGDSMPSTTGTAIIGAGGVPVISNVSTIGAFEALSSTSSLNTGGNLTVNAAGGHFYLGNGSGLAQFNLNDGLLTIGTTGVPLDFWIGSANGGRGIFTQTGGTLNATVNNFYIGYNSGTGSLTFTSGSISANNLLVGNGGNSAGTVTQSGGVITTASMTLGNSSVGSSYSLSSGTLNVISTAVLSIANNGTFNQSGGVVTATGGLDLARNSLSAGYLISGGILNAYGGQSNIGSGGNSNGFFTQTGGTVNMFGGLRMSTDQNSQGTGQYNMSGGLLNIVGSLWVGTNGSGTAIFTLSGTGAVNASGVTLVIANSASVIGQFVQSQTTSVTVGSLVVGQAVTGLGTYQQQGSSSTMTSSGQINIGSNGGTGVYSLLGGTVSATQQLQLGNGINNAQTNTAVTGGTNRVYTSYISSGTFIQSGGLARTVSDLSVGVNGGSGVYQISGGTLSISGNTYLANGTGASVTGSAFIDTTGVTTYYTSTTTVASKGIVTQTGGVVNAVGAFNVGHNGGNGTYNMQAGSLTVGGQVNIGNNAGSIGTFAMTGGTLALSSTSDLYIGNGDNSKGTFIQGDGSGTSVPVVSTRSLIVGDNGSVATYQMNSGTLNLTGDLIVARRGNNGIVAQGTFNQTGGVVNGNNVYLGYWDGSDSQYSHAVMTISGSAIMYANQLQFGMQYLASGTLNMLGGLLQANTINNGQGSGVINLNGGNLLTNSISTSTDVTTSTTGILSSANDTSRLQVNFNGGTLTARSTNTNFINDSLGRMTISINSAGGTIDTNGYSVGVNASMSGAGALTVNSSIAGGKLTLTKANTYTGNTVIGSGATLLLTGSGSLASSKIIVSTASSVFDVSGVSGYYALNNQTLAGIGTINGKLQLINNSIINVGNGAIGTLTFNGILSVSDGSVMNFVLGASGINSSILFAGGATSYFYDPNVDGGITVNFDPLTGLGSGHYSYNLMDAGSNGFDLNSFTLGSYDSSIYENVLLSQNNNLLVLSFDVIPEPSTYALLLAGGVILAFTARRCCCRQI
jgi:hypothetical protein